MTSHAPSKFVTPPWQLTLALAMALAAAGTIHSLLTLEHMEISVVFGAGFLAAGIAQFGMAAMAVIRPSRLVYAVIIATTVALTGLYAYNVVVGLPFHEASPRAAGTDGHTAGTEHGHSAPGQADGLSVDHHEAGVVMGGGEPIDPYGALTQLAQLSAAALAVTLLVRRTPSTT